MKKLPILGFYGYWVVLTYLGVMSAVTGIYFALGGNIRLALVCLMVSGVCDLFDGAVARTAKRTDREKQFGIQIDSLADIIAFGILPTAIGYAVYINHRMPENGIAGTICTILIMGIGAAALEPVQKSMGDPLETKTITLSCGKLTTGVTVKPWTGIFVLRNLSSPETYFQAAFRVQTPGRSQQKAVKRRSPSRSATCLTSRWTGP